MKTIEYNKLKFTSENNEPDLIDYYLSDENKAHPFIKYLPKNAIRQRIINTPIFQEIHTGYNPHANSLKSISINSPNIIDYEITIDDDNIFSNNISNTSNYKLYSKPISYKNDNPINNNDNNNYNYLSIVNENQNRARSPRIVRNNNLNINDEINNNYEVMIKSNSFSNLNKKSESPQIKIQNPNFNTILNFNKNSNNYNSLPMNYYENHYRANSCLNNNISTEYFSKSPLNIKKRRMPLYDGFQNNFNLSTNHSTKHNTNINNKRNNLSRIASSFEDKCPLYMNDINSCQNKTFSNQENYDYIIDNPTPNTFGSIYQNDITSKNINLNKQKYTMNNDFQIIYNNPTSNIQPNYQTTTKIYKSKIPKAIMGNNLNRMSTNIKYAQNHPFSPSPQKTSYIKLDSGNNGAIYQYQYQKSISPPSIKYNVGNNKALTNQVILDSKIGNQYSKIKSSLPKITNFANKLASNYEFSSNNINDISFSDNKFSHKTSMSDNNFNIKLSKKNLKEEDLDNNENIHFNKSNIKKNKISKLKKHNKYGVYKSNSLINISNEYYIEYMYDHINSIRTKPQSFIKYLKSAINNISCDKKGNLFYDGNLKVALCKGKIVFEETISFLEKVKPMKPLIFRKELCVPIPIKEKDFESGDYLRKKIKKIIDKGVSVRAFWRDIIKDPEINFLIMIVDDNFIRRGAKRKDILNSNMKYIGINSGSMGDYFVCYTVLSDE